MGKDMEKDRIMKHIRRWILLCAVTLPLGMVCVTSAGFPPGETISQWTWFDRAASVASVCILLTVVWGRKDRLPAPAEAVQGALLILGGVEAVWGLRQVFGFTMSGHSLYALTGSFFNPGPYSGYLAMVLPVCLHGYLTADTRWKRRVCGAVMLPVLCVLPAGMSRSAWMAGAAGCLWVWVAGGRASGWIHAACEWFRKGSRWKMPVVAGTAVCVLALAASRLLVWDFTDRGVLPSSTHDWGVAPTIYVAAALLLVVAAIWLFMVKRKAKAANAAQVHGLDAN